MSNQKPLLLKVLSGTHLGVEVLLPPGRYLVGRDNDSDLVLSDEMIGKEHAWIELDSDSVCLKPIDNALVTYRSRIMNDAALSLGLYETFTLGTTRMAIGEPGGDWSRVTGHDSGLNASQLGSFLNQAVSAPLRKLMTSSANDSWANTMHSMTAPLRGAMQGGSRKPTHGGETKNSRGVFSYIAIAMTMGLAPVALGLTGQFSETGAELSINRKAEPHYLLKVRKFLGQESVEGVSASITDGGDVQLTGAVKNHKTRARILERIQRRGIPYDDSRLTTQTSLVEQTDELLGAIGMDELEVSYAGDGEVAVSGYVTDRTQWEGVKATLRNDIRPLLGIREQIDTIDSRRKELQRRIEASPIDNKLKVHKTGESALQVSGSLNRDEKSQWKDVVSGFIEDYGEYPRIRSRIDPVGKLLGMEIQGIVISDSSSYVLLEDGTRYREGATTGEGYTVESIEPNRVILAGNEGRRILSTGI